jgi:hypothetical protein
MDEQNRVRLEYDSASQMLRDLTDTSFKLLALVPTLAGAVVAFATTRRSGLELLAIGLLGLVATIGVLLYELRNAEIKRGVARRVRRLEDALLPNGRLVTAHHRRFLGALPVSHSAGVALVYSAAIGGWGYLVAWGALHAVFPHRHVQGIGIVIGVVAALVTAGDVLRIERAAEREADVAGAAEKPVVTH